MAGSRFPESMDTLALSAELSEEFEAWAAGAASRATATAVASGARANRPRTGFFDFIAVDPLRTETRAKGGFQGARSWWLHSVGSLGGS